MKYSRGRIIALAILSVTMAFALFCTGYVINLRSFTSHAVQENATSSTSGEVKNFDDLYQRIPFGKNDTGSVTLGTETRLTLTEERYRRGVLTELLNASVKQSFTDLQSTKRAEGYPYPIYSNEDMKRIASGLGNSLQIPVVMLDPYNYDDIVLFELTNLISTPTEVSITRDGNPLSDKLIGVDSSLGGEYVYSGAPRYTLVAKTEMIEDANQNAVLSLFFKPNTAANEGYVVEIRDLEGNYLYIDKGASEFEQIENIANGTTSLYNEDEELVYKVVRNDNEVSIYDVKAGEKLLETVTYVKADNQLVSYDIGAVAYNGNALRAMFQEEGVYQISFKQKISTGDGVVTEVSVSFAFAIVNKMNYQSFPRFNPENRMAGSSEIYNYSYENEYPTVEYSSLFFDVQIHSSEEYDENDPNDAQRELCFYNIGQYRMVSALQYYNAYMASREQEFSKRGVNKGIIRLNQYTQYNSVLNIYGFQAYYGGQHSNSKYNGPLPFYDSEYGSVSSDISKLVRDVQMTAGDNGFDYKTMRVSDATTYSNQLANYLTTSGVKPVRTNFPPVKIEGNVLHATGAGTNGEKAVVLSTVAYKASYGLNNAGQWVSSTLEDGAPFEKPGQYLITIYFKVNNAMCQQNFFFEIVNSAKIAFEVTDALGNTSTYYAGDLELQRAITGKTVKISYDGNTTLGQFEVPPVITLESAQLGGNNYSDMNIQMQDNGAFEFTLNPKQYRLTVKYGAHNKSTSVFDIIVDDTLATGMKANTQAKSLPGMPSNIAVVGAGDVSLTWDQKPSGVNFTNVLCEFYEMNTENINANDPNYDRNYFELSDSNLQKIANLYTAHSFVSDASIPNNGYEPIKTADGWTLSETFNLPGLYVFTLIDEVGNETEFILIIDQSAPVFVQSGEKNNIPTNAVNFDDNVGVYIGFGTNKLIAGSDPVFDQFTVLGESGVLTTDMRDSWPQSAISIGLAKIEYSVSGETYQEVSKADRTNGYIVLKEENTYYFRVTDVLGNVGEYYIILTHDNCFGTVYADAVRPVLSTESSDVGRGVIADEPNINTSLVTMSGGMTNRAYVSFSFQQKSKSEQCYVDKIYLQYYPLTYQTTSSVNPGVNNPNYPFADKPVNNPKINNQAIFANQDSSNGIIYTHDNYDVGKTVRLALFDVNTTTPSGLYIITRVYGIEGLNDPAARDYYFIVDNQKMLHYAKGKYETSLRVKFANQLTDRNAKTADAEIINSSNNQLSSDRIAWVTGFNSKYSFKHDSTNYAFNKSNTNFTAGHNNPSLNTYNYNFPSLTPRFSYVHNLQTVELGAGKGTWAVGDPANASGSTDYKLLIRDDARNISCMLVNGGLTELLDNSNAPTSANYDYLYLDLELGQGTKAEIEIGDDQIISTNQMQFDGNQYYYVVHPNEIDELKFSFNSDPKSMYTNVDVKATTASWKSQGFSESIILKVPTPVNGKYTYDLMQNFLNDEILENGASLSVSLIAEDGTVTKYAILFDSVAPVYNLGRIKASDNLACTVSTSELPSNYIYGLSNDFVFESDVEKNPYLETRIITYAEADSEGGAIQPATQFKVYTGQEGEKRIPFAEIVGLRDNEMKYYKITETDYAGNNVSYAVQIQGKNYNNNISFIGAITDEDEEIQIGIEMHASRSSVQQFFMNNSSFKFESGDDYYALLGNKASWCINGKQGSSEYPEDDESKKSLTAEKLIETLDNWINTATQNGTKCSYTLYDRIGDAELFEFYNIREKDLKIQLDCYQASAGSSVIMTTVTNYDDLPKILFDEKLASLYKMTVKDITTNDAPTEVNFSLQGTPIQGFDVTHDLIITVTDPFGRVSLSEYHQQRDSTIIFTVNGNTVTQDNKLYVGDKRGVTFSYLRTAYNVLIYDEGTGEVLSNLQSFISNDMVRHTFVPKDGSTTIEEYRIEVKGRASGAVMFDKIFVFDTRLPDVNWKNASDQPITVNGQTFVSDVCFDISDSLVPTAFPVTISYTRTFNNKVERVTLKQGTEKFTFKQPGKYEVTLRNTVWAEKTYTFEIEQINDDLVTVFDDGKQIQASPSDYKFYDDQGEEIYITRYVFTVNQTGNSIAEYASHGLAIKIGHTNRELAGNPNSETDFYYYDSANNTLVWRLAFFMGESNGVKVYDNPIYFATTGVVNGELNTGSSGAAITLQLNGNPDIKGNSNAFIITPSQTTYHFINDSFMQAHNNKVEVKLYCDSTIMRDDEGMPCYMREGNVIVVDCYYNGNLVKTLTGDGKDEVFIINRYDAGYYEFIVHDLVGNNLYFGSSNNQNDVNYRQERYMLIVMTKPMVLINGKQPVNGMIYNDEVELTLVNYGNEFLSKLYAEEVEKDKFFFKKYYCITKIEGVYSGSNKEDILINTDGTQTDFYWNKTGTYRIRITYRINENIFDNLEAEYQFQIIPAQTIRESFSMPIYPDIQVASVTRNGYKINDFDNYKINDVMNFSADLNPGAYVVTLKTYDSIIQEYVTHDVKFNIQHKKNSASNYFVLSSGSGTATIGEVTLYYNPYWLYTSQGKVTIYLYKNFVEQKQVVVDSSVLEGDNYNTKELFTVKDTGLYSVIVKDGDGDPVYMDSWTVEAEQSTFGYIILAVVFGIAGVGILVFLRMRSKMTTK